jgi:chemotaxis methyl-accepting protein methylase
MLCLVAPDFSLAATAPLRFASFEVLHHKRTESVVGVASGRILVHRRVAAQLYFRNLLSDFSHLGMFDVIFCRNVLIYFDQQTKIDLLERLAQAVTGDGYLVLGAAETVGLTDSFMVIPDKRGLYAPNPRLPLRFAAANKPSPRLVAVNAR